MNVFGFALFRRLLVLLLAGSVVASGVARAQSDPPPLKPEEIEALVAPIALYPDALLSQVLMASTYPLEVVQAARWQKANPNLKGDDAVKAVENQPWDISVKSLVAFPQILEPMEEKIDWTQKLGDAFLADEKAVFDAVQRLRAKAQASGNLKSTEQQKVVVEQAAPQQTVIVIEPAQPNVIYVPSYNPTVVYGPWLYPAFPPFYWPPSPIYYPGGWHGGGFAWGVAWGFAAGAIYGGVNWRRGDVNINVNRAVNIDRSFNRNNIGEGGRWKHDASHRKGVAYRDNASRQKYGRDVAGAAGRQEYRGRVGDAVDRAGLGDRAGNRVGDRAGDRARVGDAVDRAGLGDRAGDRLGDRIGDRAGDRAGNRVVDRPGGRVGAAEIGAGVSNRAGGMDRGAGAGRDNALSGVGNAKASQRDFSRGAASNSSMARSRGGAGGVSGASRPSPAVARPSGGGGARGGVGAGRGGGGGR